MFIVNILHVLPVILKRAIPVKHFAGGKRAKQFMSLKTPSRQDPGFLSVVDRLIVLQKKPEKDNRRTWVLSKSNIKSE